MKQGEIERGKRGKVVKRRREAARVQKFSKKKGAKILRQDSDSVNTADSEIHVRRA